MEQKDGCDWPRLCVIVAQEGHLRLLKWIKANGYEFLPAICTLSAADNDHLEVLEWLRSLEGGLASYRLGMMVETVTGPWMTTTTRYPPSRRGHAGVWEAWTHANGIQLSSS